MYRNRFLKARQHFKAFVKLCMFILTPECYHFSNVCTIFARQAQFCKISRMDPMEAKLAKCRRVVTICFQRFAEFQGLNHFDSIDVKVTIFSGILRSVLKFHKEFSVSVDHLNIPSVNRQAQLRRLTIRHPKKH